MQAYNIEYTVKSYNDNRLRNLNIDAKNAESARKKIAKRHGFKDDPEQIEIKAVHIIGYF